MKYLSHRAIFSGTLKKYLSDIFIQRCTLPIQFTLTATGDSVIRHRLYEGGKLRWPQYQETIDFLRSGDAAWGVCEVQFSERGFRTDSLVAYRVVPSVAADLAAAGFNIMSVATNHTWDFGPDAFLDTLDNLREAGIRPVGGGAHLDEALAPVVLEANGMRIGFLAASCLLPPYYAATDDRPGIAPLRVHQSHDLDPLRMMIEPGAPLAVRSRVDERDLQAFVQQIRKLTSQVDFVVASVHWGYGRGEPLAEYQRPLGHALIEGGADMVLGNHTHSPSGIEIHRGKPIVYGLGNHIAQQDRAEATAAQKAIFADIDPWSVLARFTLTTEGVTRIELVPTECGESGLPIPMQDPTPAAPVLNRLARLCHELGTKLKVDGLRAEVVL